MRTPPHLRSSYGTTNILIQNVLRIVIMPNASLRLPDELETRLSEEARHEGRTAGDPWPEETGEAWWR